MSSGRLSDDVSEGSRWALASRRALCIGVSSFAPIGANDGDEPDLTPFEGLDYAAEYTRELHAALQVAGYDADLAVDPANLGEKQRITSGELDLAPTVRAVGFDVLFERIRKEVRALALAEGGHLQDPMATPVLGAEPELPFFTASTDATVRIWDLGTRRQVDRIDLPGGVNAIDVTAAREIVARFGWDLVLLERTSNGKP
jgi:hypothetical protein